MKMCPLIFPSCNTVVNSDKGKWSLTCLKTIAIHTTVFDINRIPTEQMEKHLFSFWCKMVLKRPTIPVIDQGPISRLYPLLTPNFLRLTARK